MLRLVSLVSLMSLFLGACNSSPESVSSDSVLNFSPTNPITDIRNPEAKGKNSLTAYTDTDANECENQSCASINTGASTERDIDLYSLSDQNYIACRYEANESLQAFLREKNYSVMTVLKSSQPQTGNEQDTLKAVEVRAIDQEAGVYLDQIHLIDDQASNENFSDGDVYAVRNIHTNRVVSVINTRDFARDTSDGSTPNSNVAHFAAFIRMYWDCRPYIVDSDGEKVDTSDFIETVLEEEPLYISIANPAVATAQSQNGMNNAQNLQPR